MHFRLITFLSYHDTVGTTRAQAGSAQAFSKIDREYVIAAARAALVQDTSNKQKVLYCSAPLANSKSKFLYTQSKGMTEEGLGEYGWQSEKGMPSSDEVYFGMNGTLEQPLWDIQIVSSFALATWPIHNVKRRDWQRNSLV